MPESVEMPAPVSTATLVSPVAQVGASFIASSLSMALARGKRVAVSAGFTYSHVRAAAACRTGQAAAPAVLS